MTALSAVYDPSRLTSLIGSSCVMALACCGDTVSALIGRTQESHILASCGAFLVRVFVHASPLAHNVHIARALAVRV